MTEHESIRGRNELTKQANSSNLRREEDIFMPEGSSNSPEQLPSEPGQELPKRPVHESKTKAARSAWAALNEERIGRGDKITPEERQTQEMLIRMGILPQSGGSDDEPNKENQENEQLKEILYGIYDNSEFTDTFTAFEAGLYQAPLDSVGKAISLAGEFVSRFFSTDLPQESIEKYEATVRGLSGLSDAEIRDGFIKILEDIREERDRENLPLPGVKEYLKNYESQLNEIFGSTERPEPQPEADEEEESASLEEEDTAGELTNNETMAYINEVLERARSVDASNTEEIEIIKKMTRRLIKKVYGEGAEADRENPKMQELNNRLELILQDQDPRRLRMGVNKFMKDLFNTFQAEQEMGNGREEIGSVQDLAKYIFTKQNHELWGPEGILPLLKENGELNEANFLMWLREQIVKLHGDNPNSDMLPLNSVGIQSRFGSFISIYLMTRFPDQYLKNEKGGVLTKLSGELLNEAFSFGFLRSDDLTDRRAMGSDEELPKVQAQMHITNNLSRGSNLKSILEMPEEFGREGDTKVGDAVRLINEFYYNLSDREKLIEILGGEDKMFTRGDFKNALRIIQKKKDWEEIDDYGGHYDPKNPDEFFYIDRDGIKQSLFDSTGKLDMNRFIDCMNFFANPTAESSSIELLRELVRQKFAANTELDTGLEFTGEAEWAEISGGMMDFDLYRKAKRINIEFAELTAFVMQRQYGGAARNDTGRIGHDAMAKLFLQEYLLKQSGRGRGGAIGVPEEIGVFRSLSTDYWTGLQTESGLTPYEIFEKIRSIEKGEQVLSDEGHPLTKMDLLGMLKFRENAENQFTHNQVVRAFQIFHSISGADQLDLSQIVTYSPLEGVKYNPQKFQEMINEKFIKPMRYAFLNSGLKYGQRVRRYDAVRGRYETVTLAENMFSEEVLDGINIANLGDRDEVIDLVKHAARTRIAAQLRFHRKFGSVGERWNFARTETFIRALETIEEYEEDVDRPGRVRRTGGRYFSNEDIDWIRKHSGSEIWRMVLTDSMMEATPALAQGSLEGLMKFMQAVVK